MTHTIRQREINYYLTEKHHDEEEEPEQDHYYAQIVEEYGDEYFGEELKDKIFYEVVVYHYETGNDIQHLTEGTLESWQDVLDHLKYVKNYWKKNYYIDEKGKSWELMCTDKTCELCNTRLGKIVRLNESLPECPECGESGIFDSIGFPLDGGAAQAKYSCSHCEHTFRISADDYIDLQKHVKIIRRKE